jgi:hypothetical protein
MFNPPAPICATFQSKAWRDQRHKDNSNRKSLYLKKVLTLSKYSATTPVYPLIQKRLPCLHSSQRLPHRTGNYSRNGI